MEASADGWVICRDVTEQVDYTELLFRERNFSNALIECLPGIFYVTEETGKVLRWNRNAEVLSGYSPEEFSQMTSSDFLPPEHRNAVAAAFQQLIKTGGYEEMELEYVTKSGKRLPFWINGKQIVLDGKTCVVGIGMDISKLKNTEAKAARTERRIGRPRQRTD